MLQTTLTCSLYDAPSTGDSGLLQALDRWSKALTHWAKAWKKALRAHQRHLETRCECEIYLPYYKMKCFPPHILGKYKLWLGAPLQWFLFLERWVPSTPAYRTWGPRNHPQVWYKPFPFSLHEAYKSPGPMRHGSRPLLPSSTSLRWWPDDPAHREENKISVGPQAGLKTSLPRLHICSLPTRRGKDGRWLDPE